MRLSTSRTCLQLCTALVIAGCEGKPLDPPSAAPVRIDRPLRPLERPPSGELPLRSPQDIDVIRNRIAPPASELEVLFAKTLQYRTARDFQQRLSVLKGRGAVLLLGDRRPSEDADMEILTDYRPADGGYELAITATVENRTLRWRAVRTASDLNLPPLDTGQLTPSGRVLSSVMRDIDQINREMADMLLPLPTKDRP